MNDTQTGPGKPYPLGSTWDGAGTNFALFSEHATAVTLQLFDSPSHRTASRTVHLTERTAHVWHCHLPGVSPGQLYGYRVDGPYEPDHGHRFNRHKLLIDPYARAIAGSITWDPAIFGFSQTDPAADMSFDTRDSAGNVPSSVVVDDRFDWGADRPLDRPWEETVLYETHVKGISAAHPDVDKRHRGTFSGLASPAIIDHLRHLGVTAVQLMPVHHHALDRSLALRGATNYWGYNTLGFFAPDSRFSASGDTGGQVVEFKKMVKALHTAGIEVILDVVYNHTAEGDHLGPTLCFRGVDNASYYHLRPDHQRFYLDFTGCGCSLRSSHPCVLQLTMDSLRYWVQQMHVDGFRFDLATTLGRSHYDFSRFSAFLAMVHQDPVLSRVKLIAEPWDLGPDGFQLGGFPAPWSELNARFRDTVRRYWCGQSGLVADMAYRLAGSSDQFRLSGRTPQASINFVTAHDGFTMADLVSYERKHNEGNGENNLDGLDHNDSCNHGVEGVSTDPAIASARLRHRMNLMATMMLSQGVPMMLGGDELGRTQSGNNNAYCQDNPLGWYDWSKLEQERGFVEFTRGLAAIRQTHPVLRRRAFFEGHTGPLGLKDVTWLGADGSELKDSAWQDHSGRVLGMLLAGDGGGLRTRDGRPLRDQSLLLVVNNGPDNHTMALPGHIRIAAVLVDTGRGVLSPGGMRYSSPDHYALCGNTVVLLEVDYVRPHIRNGGTRE